VRQVHSIQVVAFGIECMVPIDFPNIESAKDYVTNEMRTHVGSLVQPTWQSPPPKSIQMSFSDAVAYAELSPHVFVLID
jgi:hypothetical protein